MMVAAAGGGCESAPRTSSLETAISAYEQGNFTTGHKHATAAMEGLGGNERADASYLAGLCAFRLGNLNEAELRFELAVEIGDTETAARSRAMLGLIRERQGRHVAAAELLQTAAGDLEGSDRARAEEQAKASWRRAGVDPASAASRSTELGSGFSLQAGAFREQDRAQAAAGRLKPLAKRHALGPVRVIRTTDRRSGAFYMVRVGRFPSRHDAARVRSDLGRDGFIVVPY
jgi:tetratricopeptide (TPR) repeat protein